MKTKKIAPKKPTPAHKSVVINDLVPASKLDSWIKNRYNVLFEGQHGVGKTAIILDAFKRAGLRYAYFSGATMDPFIDFIGVPVKVKDASGKDVIEMVRPKHLVDANVQAIFIDEFNRSHKKVRNAVMELMQFKTINGKPISKDLRVVWAAINPDEDADNEYDVDRIDPAQRDRFQIQLKIPYQCSAEFFKHKFGTKGETAVLYWNKLPKEAQRLVSPRRLEYALEVFTNKGDIRDALPLEANPSKLLALLKGKGYQELDPLLSDQQAATDFFQKEENYAIYIDDVLKHSKYNSLIDVLPPEKICSLLLKKQSRKITMNHIQRQVSKGNALVFKSVLESIAQAHQSSIWPWCKTMVAKMSGAKPAKPRFNFGWSGAKPKVPKVKSWKPPVSGSGYKWKFRDAIANVCAANKGSGRIVTNKDFVTAVFNLAKRGTSHTTVENFIDKRGKKWLANRGFLTSKQANGWLVL